MVITKSFNLDINTPWKAPTLYIKQGDADSRKLQATIRRDGVNYVIPGDVFATFRMHKPDDTFVTQDCTISGSVVSVVMDAQCATAAGHGKAEFVLQTASEVVSTFNLAIEILPAVVTDGDIESRDALGEYRTILEEMLRVKGAPLTANTAADMTDTDRVYVYTGSEVGYVNGSWYYYDGSSWVVGGVYNSQAISDSFRDEIADMVKQSAVASESDSVPYLFRPTPNPSAILADEEIVGGTIAYNQLVQNGNFEDTSSWTASNPAIITLSASGNVLSVASSANGDYRAQQTLPAAIEGHKYFITADIKAATINDVALFVYLGSAAVGQYYTVQPSDTNWHNYATIRQGYTGTVNQIRLQNGNANTTNQYQNVMVKDLTAEYGAQIADYLYTLESGTSGAGVAKLREWGFLSKDYFPYNAGSLVSVNTSGKRVTGFNLLNPASLDALNVSKVNGCWQGAISNWISTITGTWRAGWDGIQYLPNTKYFASAHVSLTSGTTNVKLQVYYTDGSSKTGTVMVTAENEGIISVESDEGKTVSYFRITYGSGNTGILTVYWMEINVSSNMNGVYVPYRQPTTYPTTPTDLNGIFKLDANNNLYADGDVYHASGTITRKWAEVVLDGSANVALVNTSGDAANTGAWSPYDSIGITNALFVADNRVTRQPKGNSQASETDTIWCSNAAPRMWFAVPKTVTTTAELKTYLTSNPITVYYPVATPTTDAADTYPATQIAGSMEERIDNRAVPVPVGHRTTYSIGVPDVPASGSNLVLKATVSGGKTTLKWE